MRFFKESFFTVLVLLILCPGSSYSQDIVTMLAQTQEISLFSKALSKAGIDQRLSQSETFTIFAPTNTAFQKEMSSKNYSQPKLKSFLLNHIMTGWATHKNLKAMSKTTSLGGITLNFVINNDNVEVNQAKIIQKNIKAENGVIHVIDAVLK